MSESTNMGMNRTGVGMAPKLRDKMFENSQVPVVSGDGHEMERVRRDYLSDAPVIGSTPPPSTISGAAQAGVEMVLGHKPTVFMDKLGERLAFERTGVRLYEGVMTKFEAQGSWEGGPSHDELSHFRDEELKHYQMVREAIESMGGDPTAVTPAADVAGVASEGVLQVIMDPRTRLSESLEALLVAELTDNDGWAMLIQLADILGYKDLSDRFRIALQEENTHLDSVRHWLSVLMQQDAKRELE